jgi:hypothetical protein
MAATEAAQFPLDELAKHRGEWIAWSPDGTRIVASSRDPAALEDLIRATGEDRLSPRVAALLSLALDRATDRAMGQRGRGAGCAGRDSRGSARHVPARAVRVRRDLLLWPVSQGLACVTAAGHGRDAGACRNSVKVQL